MAQGRQHRRTLSLVTLHLSAKPFSLGDKLKDKAATESIAQAVETPRQNLFYADKRYKLLVDLCKATQTSARTAPFGALASMSALGVHAVGWSAPTEAERAHDYLWRIHQRCPACGRYITVFNRSHYEDVLAPAVNGIKAPQDPRCIPTLCLSN